MIRLVIGNEAEWVPDWCSERLEIADFRPCIAMGIIDGDKRLAGIVYNLFSWPHISASIASDDPRWCNRRILRGIFSYPFGQLNCQRVTAITEDKNQPARAFLCRLGFREEGTLRKWFPNGDGIAFGMLVEECRWFQTGEQMHRAVA